MQQSAEGSKFPPRPNSDQEQRNEVADDDDAGDQNATRLDNDGPAATSCDPINSSATTLNNNNGSSLSSGSPRRKKPPLDLDSALYLQSTASYVQEPASQGARSGGTRSATLPSQLAGSASSGRASSQTPTAGTPLWFSGGQQQQQPSQRFTFGGQPPPQQQHRSQADGYYDLNYAPYSRGNISVDYIDCVSNDDLATEQVSSSDRQDVSGAAGAMKGIPHCRKHLRFRRNRIDPDLSQQQQVVGAQGQLAATSALSCDSSSNVTSSLNGDESLSSFNMDSRAANATSGVLYPISVSEAKKRTYFIGSLAQDSLLGHEELHRYFPNGRVSIFVCTWNQNRKRSPMNLNELLLPDQLNCMSDIYAVGIQEAFSSQNDYLKEWEIELQTTLGPNHVLLHSCSLGVLHLSLFVRRDLIWFCSVPEESVYNSRSMPTNMIKTKGAISIALRFFGTSFMFTNCHFPAHENKLKDRIDEYQRIINSIDLPKNLKLLKPRYLSNDSTARFDCVFFMGDLNFRLEQRTFDETIHILEDIFQQKDPSYEALTQNDELLKVMETNQAFHGFDESQIKFPPTYKFLAQTNKYDRQTKRVPSYTDRILFRSKRQRHIQCLIYDWLPQLVSSDHKPVYCLFDVLIRPGRDQNMVSSLNAGLFQRSVYLEALKRRAEDPDAMRGENGAGSSLICTIS